MKKLIGSLILSLIMATSAFASGFYPTGQTGTDIGYPNCGTRTSAPFGLVGVTGGTVYSSNSCLTQEAVQFSNLSLYVNTGWYSASTHINPNSPNVCSAGDENCLAYNYGYNAGLDALNVAHNSGVTSDRWWLDVETANSWASDRTQNRNSLQGEYDALTANGASLVGVYSTTAQWDAITGTWLNNWPNWGATIVHTAKQAKTFCSGHQFTGGATLLIQFKGKLDQDYAC